MRAASIVLCAGLAGCLPVPVGTASPLSAFHPPAVLIAMSAGDATTCRIEAEQRAGLVYLSGVVHAQEDMVATASLRVRRTGAGGTSDNLQGGMFGVRAGEEAIVGQVAVNAGADDDLSAELTVAWEGGQAACQYP